MNELAKPDHGKMMESVIMGGDLSVLSPTDRVRYYNEVCQSLGLNPLTQPFAYMKLQGKLSLYARRECTEQLRKLHGISITITSKELVDDCYVVSAKATDSSGRSDEDIGAVSIQGLKGEARANAMLKCITKAKRRVTLSICGLGMLDEHEVETIPGVAVEAHEPLVHPDTLEIVRGYLMSHEISNDKLQEMLAKCKVTRGEDLTEKMAQKWIARFQQIEQEFLDNQEKMQWDGVVDACYHRKVRERLPRT